MEKYISDFLKNFDDYKDLPINISKDPEKFLEKLRDGIFLKNDEKMRLEFYCYKYSTKPVAFIDYLCFRGDPKKVFILFCEKIGIIN